MKELLKFLFKLLNINTRKRNLLFTSVLDSPNRNRFLKSLENNKYLRRKTK